MKSVPFVIQTAVNGQPIRGHIASLSQRSIVVEILHPYSGVRDSRSIPAFAMHAAVKTGNAYENDTGLTSAGRASASDLLEALYRACHVFDTNRKRLWEVFWQIRRHEDAAAQYGDEIFHAARKILRSRLRAGEITHPDYQRALAPLARQQGLFKRRRQRIERGMEEFLLLEYGMLISGDTVEQLIRKFLI